MGASFVIAPAALFYSIRPPGFGLCGTRLFWAGPIPDAALPRPPPRFPKNQTARAFCEHTGGQFSIT